MKKNTWTLVVAGGLVAILVIYTVCFTVQAGTVGVVYTLGAINESGVKEDPDIYLKWPWPFQTVEPVDTRVRLLEVPGTETTTQDEFNILVTVAAGWRIQKKNVVRFLESFPSTEDARRNLQDEIRGTRKSLVQQIRLGDLISVDPKQADRFEKFEADLRKTVQKKLDAGRYGMEISFLRVKRIAFPKSTTEKVFQRMINERKRASEAFIAEGKKQAEIIKDNARLEKDNLLSEARREATKIRGEGDATAAEHYKVFKENPELANFLRRLDALKEILGKRSTVVLPGKGTLDEYLIEQPSATGK